MTEIIGIIVVRKGIGGTKIHFASNRELYRGLWVGSNFSIAPETASDTFANFGEPTLSQKQGIGMKTPQRRYHIGFFERIEESYLERGITMF